MAHQTPRSLNHSLRLGRLTAPQWTAVVVGIASLWVCAGFAARVADPNAHILAVALPTMLVVTPILVLWRGGVERYAAQLTRYAARQSALYTARAGRRALVYAHKGGTHAHARLHAARRRQG